MQVVTHRNALGGDPLAKLVKQHLPATVAINARKLLPRLLRIQVQPKRALAAYERALSRHPEQAEAQIGRLRVYAHYGLSGGLDLARARLSSGVDDARVVVAAAELLDSVGADAEATQVLEQAWIDMPENGILRRERLRRGLPVDD